MDSIIRNGTTTPDDKESIFHSAMIYLATQNIKFSFEGYGNAKTIRCTGPLDISLDLVYSNGKADELMVHGGVGDYMVNNLETFVQAVRDAQD